MYPPPPRIQAGCRLMVGLVFDTLLLFAVSCVALMGVPQLWPVEDQDQDQDQETSPSPKKLPGFFCSDPSLNYPPSDEEPLVGGLHKTFIVVVVPSVLIVAMEMFRAAFETSFGHGAGPKRLYYFLGVPVPTFVSECYKSIGVYYFGLAVQHIIGELTKSQVKRLRPTFLASCQPRMADGSTCEDAANRGRFIEDYVCSTTTTGREEDDSEEFFQLLEGSNRSTGEDFTSFPCLMVSAVSYAIIFLIVYMHSRLKDGGAAKFRSLLQFIAFMVIVVVAIEPVTSHRNHIGDMVAGCLIGLGCGFFVALTVTQLGQSASDDNVYSDVAFNTPSWADKHGPLPMVPAVAAPYSYTPAKHRPSSQSRRSSSGLYSRHYRQVRPTSRPTYESYYEARGHDYGYSRNSRHY